LPAAIEIDDAPVLAGCWLLVTGRPSSVATALQKKQIEMTRSGDWGRVGEKLSGHQAGNARGRTKGERNRLPGYLLAG